MSSGACRLTLPQQLPDLIDTARRAIPPARAVVLVAGGSSTGKSSLVAAEIAAAFGADACLLAQDMQQSGDMTALDPRYARDDPANYGIDACIAAIDAFRRGEEIHWPHYDFRSAKRSSPQMQPEARILILEGLFAAQPALHARADWTVYVEAPAAQRLIRRLLRGQHERYPDRPLTARSVNGFLTTVQAAHDDQVRPQRQRADLIVHTEIRFAELRRRHAVQAMETAPAPVLWSTALDHHATLTVEADDVHAWLRVREGPDSAGEDSASGLSTLTCGFELLLDAEAVARLRAMDPQAL